MKDSPRWRRYLRFFGSDPAADVDDELRFHLETKVEDLVAAGWSPGEARAEARRQFGDVAVVKQTCETAAKQRERQMNLVGAVSALYQDIWYGAIQIKQSLGTSLLAVITLGIGMGVVTAVFSVIYAVVLHPLPFSNPQNLVTIWSTREGIDDVMTPRNFDALIHHSQSFARLGALESTTFTLSQTGSATQIRGGFASAGYFRVFEMRPELGRIFSADDDRSPRLYLVILSHRLWKERFGADPGLIGQEIRLNREAFTVIGVMPASFSVRADDEDIWAPLALSGQELSWTGGVFNVVGRLRAGIKRPKAQAEMNVLAHNLEKLYPEMNRGRGIRVGDYASDLIGDYKSHLMILFGAVGFVLLIACSNVANLLLARSAGRMQELAVRAALGASRIRLVRQLLTESLLFGLAGSLLGLALARALLSVVRSLDLYHVPRLDQANINAFIFLFAFGLALLCTFVSGLLPALRAAQVDIQSVLRRGGRSIANSTRDSARNIYIAVEFALAVVLLVGAGLLIRRAIAAEQIRPEFSPKRLVTGQTALPLNAYPRSEQVIQTYDRILQQLRSEPGVVNAALASKVPLSTSNAGLVLKSNSVQSPLLRDVSTELHYISDSYLATMQIPLLAGREFSLHDRAETAQVALVNSRLAHRLWPNHSAVGQVIRVPELAGHSDGWRVVGVVADVRDNGALEDSPPVLYVPFRQVSTNPWHWVGQSLFLAFRRRSDVGKISDVELLRRPLAKVDPELPLGGVGTMDSRIERSVSALRLYTRVLVALGLCGLLLTVIGIYGLVSYFVNRQRPEIGVRLALGSSKRAVSLLIIRQGMRPVLIGLIFGTIASVALTHLLAHQLYGIDSTDPVTMLLVCSACVSAAVCACYFPARRAACVDPIVALRAE